MLLLRVHLLVYVCKAAEAATPLPKLESLDIWCQKLRDADYVASSAIEQDLISVILELHNLN